MNDEARVACRTVIEVQKTEKQCEYIYIILDTTQTHRHTDGFIERQQCVSYSNSPLTLSFQSKLLICSSSHSCLLLLEHDAMYTFNFIKTQQHFTSSLSHATLLRTGSLHAVMAVSPNVCQSPSFRSQQHICRC